MRIISQFRRCGEPSTDEGASRLIVGDWIGSSVMTTSITEGPRRDRGPSAFHRIEAPGSEWGHLRTVRPVAPIGSPHHGAMIEGETLIGRQRVIERLQRRAGRLQGVEPGR